MMTTRPRSRTTTAAVLATLDSPAAAQHALDQAALLRTQATTARADAAAIVQAARETLATAERRARVLGSLANGAEPFAVEFETRARVVGAVRAYRAQYPAGRARLEALETEYEALTERAETLSQRLGELDAERAQLDGRLAASRAAGDVGEVTALRPQITAGDEVAADLRGQLQSTRGRLTELGEPGANGLLDQTRREVKELGDHYTEGLDGLGPDGENEQLQSAVFQFLSYGDQCEGEAEKARYAEILAILDAEIGFTAPMRGARAEREAIEQRNRSQVVADA